MKKFFDNTVSVVLLFAVVAIVVAVNVDSRFPVRELEDSDLGSGWTKVYSGIGIINDRQLEKLEDDGVLIRYEYVGDGETAVWLRISNGEEPDPAIFKIVD